MTLKNARVLYAHRLRLGKKVEDILRLYPQLAKESEKVSSAHGSSTPHGGTSPTTDSDIVDDKVKVKEKKNGKKSKG